MNNLQIGLALLKEKIKDFLKSSDNEPVNEPAVEPDNVSHVTGDNVVYYVPGKMKRIKVRLLYENGSLKNDYILTDYLDIKPGERVQIIILE